MALAAYAGSGSPSPTLLDRGDGHQAAPSGLHRPLHLRLQPGHVVLIGTTPLLLAMNLLTASCGMLGVGVAMIGFGLTPCAGGSGSGWAWAGCCSSIPA